MKRPALLALLALCAAASPAADPSLALLMRTRTDPTRMRGDFGAVRWRLGTAFLAGGETAFTAVCWTRFAAPVTYGQGAAVASFWSADAARATREGGAKLPAVLEMAEARGARAWTFADPSYAVPAGLENDWRYGCYAVNVETPCALTLTLAGTERAVAASNGVVQAFNVLGTAADWTLAVAPADEAATYRVGFAVNPLVRFFGVSAQPPDVVGQRRAGAPDAPLVTNEWVMAASRVRLVGGGLAAERLAAFTWGTEAFAPDEATNGTGRAAFAADARVCLDTINVGVLERPRDVWGFKVFPRWLTDDELRNVRDLDMFEMRRRGVSQRAEGE